MTTYDPKKNRPQSTPDTYTATGDAFTSSFSEPEYSAPSLRRGALAAAPPKYDYANMKLSDLDKFPKRRGLDKALYDKGYEFNEDIEAYTPKGEPEVIPPKRKRDLGEELRKESKYQREIDQARELDERENELQHLEDMRKVNLHGIVESAKFERQKQEAIERGHSRFPTARGLVQRVTPFPRPQRPSKPVELPADKIRKRQQRAVEEEPSGAVFDPRTGKPLFDPATGQPLVRQRNPNHGALSGGDIGIRLPAGWEGLGSDVEQNATFRVPTGTFKLPSNQIKLPSALPSGLKMPVPQMPANISQPGQYLRDIMPRGINIGFTPPGQQQRPQFRVPSFTQPAQTPETPLQPQQTQQGAGEIGYRVTGKNGQVKVIQGNVIGTAGHPPMRAKKTKPVKGVKIIEVRRPAPVPAPPRAPMTFSGMNSGGFTWRMPNFGFGPSASAPVQQSMNRRHPGLHAIDGVMGTGMRRGASVPSELQQQQAPTPGQQQQPQQSYGEWLRGLWTRR